MTSSDDILGQIDDAVADWTVSADAMRSRPTSMRAGQPAIHIWDEASGWQAVDGVASIEFRPDPTVFDEALAGAADLATASSMNGLVVNPWITLDSYLRTAQVEPIISTFMRVVTIHRTRRTVQVATRKYRARRKR